jgi:hypothetical protein
MREEPDGIPAPAACTELTLRDGQFGKNGTNGTKSEPTQQIVRNGDHLPGCVPRRK